MKEAKYKIMVVLASYIVSIVFIIVAFRAHMSKNVQHFTFLILFLIFIAQSLSFLHGIINLLHNIYIPAFIILICVSYITFIKIKHEYITITKNNVNNDYLILNNL